MRLQGEDTGNPASSCAEAKFAQNLGKRVILIRMVEWDQHFLHLQARVMFGMNKLTLFWLPGTPLPEDVVTAIVDALDPEKIEADDDALFRAVSTPQLPRSASAGSSSSQLSTASEFASSSGSSVEELLTFSGGELKELMKEQEDAGFRIGVLGRKRILTEIARLQSGSGSSHPALQSDPPATAADGLGDADGLPEPEPEPEAEEDWDEEPDIMLIGDEDQLVMLLFLDLPDLASMARVSRHWRTLISDDFLWERKYGWSTYACAPPTSVATVDGSLPDGVLSFRAAFRRRVQWYALPGMCLEVLDTYNIWSVARVLLVLDENHVLIWFEGWGNEWLMWLDRRYDLARVRPCGSEVAGLGKRGPLELAAMLEKQAEAIEMIRLAPSQHAADGLHDGTVFPDGNIWKIPACSPTQGVQPSCYCRGWMDDVEKEPASRRFQRTWRDMEDPGRAVIGGAKEDPLCGFDTWHSALARTPQSESGGAEPEPEEAAASTLAPAAMTLRVGMKLEAQDVQYPSLMCVATVATVTDTPAGVQIGVAFDGWSHQYDYAEMLSFEGFRPVGWSAQNGRKIELPGSRVPPPPQGWADPFDWRSYLAHCGAAAVDPAVLTASTPRQAGATVGDSGGASAGRMAASRQPTVAAGEAWAAQQTAAIHRRPWQGCVEISAGPRTPLPEPLQHAAAESASGEAETPWYLVINGAELRRSWQPDSAVIGTLDRREVVQVLELVTGSRHFPTAIGALDLRAMARCEKGWFQCRNQLGASAVRPTDAP